MSALISIPEHLATSAHTHTHAHTLKHTKTHKTHTHRFLRFKAKFKRDSPQPPTPQPHTTQGSSTPAQSYQPAINAGPHPNTPLQYSGSQQPPPPHLQAALPAAQPGECSEDHHFMCSSSSILSRTGCSPKMPQQMHMHMQL